MRALRLTAQIGFMASVLLSVAGVVRVSFFETHSQSPVTFGSVMTMVGTSGAALFAALWVIHLVISYPQKGKDR